MFKMPGQAGFDDKDGPKDPYLVEIGENIAIARQTKGMTRQQLAEAADLTALSTTLIEAGMRNMSINTLRKIAEALKTTPAALLPDGKNGAGAVLIAPDMKDAIRVSNSIIANVKEMATVAKGLQELVVRAEQVQGSLEKPQPPEVDKEANKARRQLRKKS